MDEEKNFKEETMGIKIFIVLSMTFLIIASLTFVFGIYFFGLAGIFNIFGIHYDSLWPLFWFVFFYFLLDSFADILKKAFMLFMHRVSLNNLWTDLTVHFLIVWSLLSLLNLLMESISITMGSQLIAAAIIAIIEVTLDKTGKRENKLFN